MSDDRVVQVVRAVLAALTPEPVPAPPAPEYMTVEAFADLVKVSPETVRRWCRSGGLPHVRPRPKTIRIKVAEAKVWIEGGRPSKIAAHAEAHARRGTLQ